MTDLLTATLNRGLADLRGDDPQLFSAMTREQVRQSQTLSLVASCSTTHPSILAALASAAVNVTAEGYPGRRYHAGCASVDDIERLAIMRAQELFGARFANVQSHAASTANYSVLTALLQPGDTLLGMELDSGGHLTHGSPAALSGNYYRAVGYGLTSESRIDLEQVRHLAHQHRPRVIIAGATAYPRRIDFAPFREIADEVGAVLLADISHTAGLVAAGLHPSPIDIAHITTTCTHKQLAGPRGGVILSGRDADEVLPGHTRTVRQLVQRAIFPFTQGAPALNVIAAKARAFELAAQPAFRETAQRIRDIADAFAEEFAAAGLHIVSGGTENHMVLVGLGERMSGLVAEEALEECRIVVNKNRVPGDTRPPLVTSGLRIGANSAAQRRMTVDDARETARLVVRVLDAVEPVDDRTYSLPATVRQEVLRDVARIASRYPLADYAQPQVPGPLLEELDEAV